MSVIGPRPGLWNQDILTLMAIPLVAHEALTTAYINDVDGLGVFAQQLMHVCFWYQLHFSVIFIIINILGLE